MNIIDLNNNRPTHIKIIVWVFRTAVFVAFCASIVLVLPD
jgi:hypothetical protein